MTGDARQQPHPPSVEPPAAPPPPPFPGYPPGAYPPYTLAYHQPVAVLRPTVVTVLAIIGIILASLWILAGLGSGFSLIVVFSLMGSAFQNQFVGLRALIIWQAISGAIGGLLGAVLLAACVGCLRMRPWGRRWIIWYAIADLAWMAVKFVVALAWILPMQRTWTNVPLPGATTAPAVPATPAPTTTTGASPGARATVTPGNAPLAAMTYGGLGPDDPILQTCLSAVLMSIYPVAVLFYMTRPQIKGAFTPVAPAERVG